MNVFFKFVILLSALQCCKADFCQYNFSVFDLESGVIEEVISFILDSDIIFSCAKPEFNSGLVNFWLYTNTDRSGTQIDTLNPQMLLKKTIILMPGWLCNITNDLMPELKEAYLDKYDANVIIVDWSYYAADTYGVAFCQLPYVAEAVASFLITLENNLGILINSMHIVGHSMGGQLAGLAGGNLKSQYNKTLGRITGLDPAGPLFLGKPIKRRLDKTDAKFVDVIHTNGNFLGYYPRCGHVDFYPGCGIFQNGCPFDINNIISVDFIIQKTACDHLRSVDYMIESVSSLNFKGRDCLLCPTILCFNPPISVMGESCSPSSKDTSYYLSTNGQKPFAQG